MARPNPDGLVVFTALPFEKMLPFIAQERGRELTPDEIEAEQARAVHCPHEGGSAADGGGERAEITPCSTQSRLIREL
jgi:hypothetical protein